MELTEYVVRKAERAGGSWVSAYKNINRADSDCKYIWSSPDFLPILTAQKKNVYAHYPFEWATGDAIREARRRGFRFVYPLLPPREHGQGSNGGIYDRTDSQFRKMVQKHRLKKLGFDIGLFPLK